VSGRTTTQRRAEVRSGVAAAVRVPCHLPGGAGLGAPGELLGVGAELAADFGVRSEDDDSAPARTSPGTSAEDRSLYPARKPRI